ncbi:hypothetical protein EJB05_09482 [Eragrostis curvula]|uniref:Uncharacterized protein n=1 Tax=Eragrostis curvula TaxID=38414 RepID=A0A5J9W529_9POAL|nr:hypothetical protein EJB05_09482 [Eragrostis curvula]
MQFHFPPIEGHILGSLLCVAKIIFQPRTCSCKCSAQMDDFSIAHQMFDRVLQRALQSLQAEQTEWIAKGKQQLVHRGEVVDELPQLHHLPLVLGLDGSRLLQLLLETARLLPEFGHLGGVFVVDLGEVVANHGKLVAEADGVGRARVDLRLQLLFEPGDLAVARLQLLLLLVELRLHHLRQPGGQGQ